MVWDRLVWETPLGIWRNVRTGEIIEPPDNPPTDPRADFIVGTTEPTRLNTGVLPDIIRSTDTRTLITGSAVETFENKTFPNGLVLTNAQNKTFINCLFEGRTGTGECVRAYDAGNANLKFTDCTFAQPESMFPLGYVGTSGGKMGFRGHATTLLRCQFVNVVDGFRPRRVGGGNAAFQALGCFVADLLFLSPDGGQANRQSHNDILQDDQTVDQSNVLVKGCWLAAHLNPRTGQGSLPVDPAGWTTGDSRTRVGGNIEYPSLNANANVQFAKTGIKSNYVFEYNWMFGGSAIFNAGAGAGDGGKLNDLHIRYNRVGNDMRLGATWVLIIATAATPEFVGNTYYHDGSPANIRKNG